MFQSQWFGVFGEIPSTVESYFNNQGKLISAEGHADSANTLKRPQGCLAYKTILFYYIFFFQIQTLNMIYRSNHVSQHHYLCNNV